MNYGSGSAKKNKMKKLIFTLISKSGMDQDSLNKWKEEFQNERQEQFTKVKQLQKETQKRRK